MRARSVVALCLLLLPAAVSAQRVRLGGRGRATGPTELPPTAPTIARELSYVRLPVSFESYSVITRVDAPGFVGNGISSSWTSLGAGTRADYRFYRYASATLDMTSTIYGGPMMAQTVELGMRLGPQRYEHRVYPFVDARYGYMYSTTSNVGTLESGMFPTQQFAASARYSQGFGAIGGGGMEIGLTRRFSVTTALSVMRNRMTAYDFRGTRPEDNTYTMTSWRYVLGLRFNPVRFVTQ